MAIRCANCGHVAPTGDRFCSKCGAPLAATEPSEEPAPDTEDSSWVALVGEAAPPASTRPSPPVEVAPDPQPEPIAATPIPSSAEESVADYDDRDPLPPPVGRTRDKGLWIAVVAVGIVGALALVVWTVNWAGSNDNRIEIAEESDDPAAPEDEWQAAYTDTFLSEADITLVTGAEARQRDYPTTEGTTVQRTLAPNSQVTGRWVRGRDPTTKWLKLADGGYIWEGNLSVPGGEGSPIEIVLDNRTGRFGPEIEAYLDRVRSQARVEYERIDRLPEKEREQAMNDLEGRSTWLRIPARRWHGLTVTSVAQHYEGHGVTFREDEATVRRALIAAGVRVDRDGTIPLSEEEFGSCGIASTADWAEARPYGATSLSCGV